MSQFTVLQPDICQGTVYSNAIEWEDGLNQVTAKGLLSDDDLANAAYSCVICIEQSYDGGKNWATGVLGTWQGGAVNPFAPPPHVAPAIGTSFSGGNPPPTHVRVRLELPQPLSIGAAVIFQ